MKKIIIYTDGSCLGNPGAGGWAFLVIEDQKIIIKKSGREFFTTNNRMEMTAIFQSLKYVFEKFSDAKIELYSDSNLIIQTLNQGWKRKANLDIWQQIDQYRKNLNISYEWVKAHHQDQYNNLCDEMAQEAAREAQQQVLENPDLQRETQKKSASSNHSQNQTSLF